MFDLTSMDQRLADQTRQDDRINKNDWKRTSPVAPDRTFRSRLAGELTARIGRVQFTIHRPRPVSTLPPTDA